MAVYLMLMLSAYLRPGEGLTIRRGDLIQPFSGSKGCWALLLFPQERTARSKTGTRDDSLMLDAPWCMWMNQVIALLAQGPREEIVFGFSYADFLIAFARAKLMLQLTDLVPYQARHSGPSIDRARGLRTLAEIMRRGRWQAHSSVQRYERHTRLGQTQQSFSAKQARAFSFAERHLGDMILGRLPVSALAFV